LNIAVNHSQSSAIQANNGTLIRAAICSILLHILLALIIPNVKFEAIKKPTLLTVELSKKPEPPPVAVPEPAKAEPIKSKIEPKPESKPTTKPLAIPTVVEHEPTSANTPPPTVTHQAEIISVAPQIEVAPSPMPSTPIATLEQQKPIVPSQESINEANISYGKTLWGAISKHKLYPRIAQMRGWQGEAIVELQLDNNGKLKSKKIIQSSGFDSLDKQALEMVEKAAPFPSLPEALRSSNVRFKVPIPFKLEEQ